MRVPEVTVAEVQDHLRRGALLLDVRERFEWDTEHAPGAEHVPLSRLPAAAASLPRQRTIVVVCRSGNRSARATQFLRGVGVDAVNLRGGIDAWRAAGLPLAGAGQRTGTVA